jgi:glycosyltransferase involved in cell wall biosynthesis
VSLKKPIVLAVGAFTEQKRMDLVIRAVAKLDNTSLLIVGGGGDLKDEINDLGIKTLGKERFATMTVPFEQMPEVYRTADVFTLASASSESFGNVLVEAMASGVPVVATDDPARREIVGDAGILVNPENSDEYAASLKRAMETAWGERPRKQAEKFSWDIISEKYEELFKEL